MTHEHFIFKLLDEYGLINNSTRRRQLASLKHDELIQLLDKFDDGHKRFGKDKPISPKDSPLTFGFPIIPSNQLDSITTHMLVADEVWLDDPLYEAFTILETLREYKQSGNNLERIIGQNNWGVERTISEIAAYIDYYLKARDLIHEQKLILYKELNAPFPYSNAQPLVNAILETVEHDKALRNFLSFPTTSYSVQNRLKGLFKLKPPMEELLADSGYIDFMTKWVIVAPVIVSFMDSIVHGIRGSSTDFISPELARIYRATLESIEIFNSQQPNDNMMISAPMKVAKSVPNFSVLSGIPPERLLDAAILEKDALANFKASLNQKLLQISAKPGTREWEKEIALINENISKEMISIDLAFKSIKSTFKQRFSLNLFLSVAGVFITGVGTSGQNINALAIATSAAGVTAILSGVKEMAQEFLNFQKEVQDIKMKENYFIWQLRSQKND